jgi:hypothetical protein
LLAGLIQVVIALPFWLHSSTASYHDALEDLYRGWPFIFGLDQGDVGGDDWGPFTTYFHSICFAFDTLGCGNLWLPREWICALDRLTDSETPLGRLTSSNRLNHLR